MRYAGRVTQPEQTPFKLLGGEPVVRRIVERFYEIMARDEPALARLHPCDEAGRVTPDNRERFALFFVGWLGGPQDYVAAHGHPRLRMRHARVAVDAAMRDAWVRCMAAALDAEGVAGPLRAFLDARLGDVADMLRNRPG
jgi:hemoglobin